MNGIAGIAQATVELELVGARAGRMAGQDRRAIGSGKVAGLVFLFADIAEDVLQLDVIGRVDRGRVGDAKVLAIAVGFIDP
ncbi:hypothetical protein [Novosphingobium sp.]|uniref:hypothetical protein n=1 Tax=Novosphingobium sp. TaxID=1874826 RepID=UPI001EB59A07|nr:hypothetical protein [Novosphingobium sp.]MBK9012070.1 hypothetical protein [Novosphingobium sp.]